MFSEIGSFFLILALQCHIFLFIVIVVTRFLKNNTLWKDNFFSFYVLVNDIALFAYFSAIVTLLILFASSDFSNFLVVKSSNIELPFLYKISSSWGNHEGSMLLFILIVACCMRATFFGLRKINYNNYNIYFYLIPVLVFLLLLSYVIFTSDPFAKSSFISINGNGFNPILQDPLLAIHPPILYIGYALQFCIFMLAFVYRGNNGYNSERLINLFVFFARLSFIFISSGIMLGSFWAFYELGWGGFWAWDPVENVSLLPWIISLGQIHYYKRINITENKSYIFSVISFAGFLSTIFSFFMVRSSLISSVHSFSISPLKGVFLFCIFILLISFIFFYIFKEGFFKIKKITNINSYIIQISLCYFFMSYVIIFVAIIYPLLIKNVSIGFTFYQNSFLILTLLFGIFLVIYPYLKKSVPKINLIINYAILFLIAVLIAMVNLWVGVNIKVSMLIILSILVMFSSLMVVITSKTKKNILFYTASLSHFSFGVFLLSIGLGGGLKSELIKELKFSNNVQFKEYSISLEKIEKELNYNYLTYKAFVKIKKNNNENYTLVPEKRYYLYNDFNTIETDMKFVFNNIFDFGIIYINFSNITNNSIIISLSYFPFLQLFYLSAIILIIVNFFAYFKNNIKKPKQDA